MRDFTFRTVPLVVLALMQAIMVYANILHTPIEDLFMIYGIAYAMTVVFEPLLMGVMNLMMDFAISTLKQLTMKDEFDITDSKRGSTIE